MLPRLHRISPVQQHYLDFVQTLRREGFVGDLAPDYANRTVLSTDNSLYQILPQAVVYPRHQADVVLLCKLAFQQGDIVLSPRGGGTGTNGQSLTDGLVVDLSRYFTGILAIDPDNRTARVQSGVVKERLNLEAKKHGLFFAPDTSTSNRATIGGMINTDACGQGSCVYGKTRHHVSELHSVLLDGTEWFSRPLLDSELADFCQRDDRLGEIHRVLDAIARDKGELIREIFPPLNRSLTGYDLAHIRGEDGRFNPNNILCGSEGTLAIITEATLNLEPIRRHSVLVNLRYDSFDASLRDARALMSARPMAIETVDDRVLGLARNDYVWASVGEFFPDDGAPTRGINLVEFAGDDEAELEHQVEALTARLQAGESSARGYTVARGPQVQQVWAMRKRAVGLLGNVQGEARPVAFVEDCAVPPEHLADFIAEFRALLDAQGLEYGMFGHVDAGVLHVRPALDLKDPMLPAKVRSVTDAVVALARQYHGLLWGEHGKGIRSEFVPEFFGPLYPCLQAVKGAFDPHNQLNPGKIATPPHSDTGLRHIDTTPTRGERDRQIPAPARAVYQSAMVCNGNGACFDYSPGSAMCPSWKATGQRIHSPKGRATLIKEWLRLLAEQGVDIDAEHRQVREGGFLAGLWPRIRNSWRRDDYDFSHEVHDAMAGCLACKSCAGQCPIKVNVPEFRARFLELYHGRYLRPMRDYLIGGLEFLMPWLSRVPALYNAPLALPPVQWLLREWLGMVDSPRLSGRSLNRELRRHGLWWATQEALARVDRTRAVVVVQDAFTSHFETQLVLDVLELLRRLGFEPFLAPFRPNGKPLHVHGFLGAFQRTAGRNAALLRELAQHRVPLVGVDPSITLTYRDEYPTALGTDRVPRVQLLQEWLATRLDDLRATHSETRRFRLLPHCTEQSNAAASIGDWQRLFTHLGQKLEIVTVGCCGMAGTYGHESGHVATSRKIYDLSWAAPVAAGSADLLATGYSCRSQVKRFGGVGLRHPAQALLTVLAEPSAHRERP